MPYICLHKSEWNRLKSQADPPQAPREDIQNKFIKDLIQKSQKWIKSWPDTFEGQIERIQNRQNKDHKQEADAIAAHREQKKHDNTKQAIAKARQLIFEGSSYGNQLLSALLASKVIEEREAQISFKKEIVAKDLEFEKKKYNDALYFCKVDQERQKEQRKKKNILFAFDNKCIYEELTAKHNKEKAKEVRGEREDALLMQKLLDWEKQEQEKAKRCQEDQIKHYNKEQTEYREAKMIRDFENYVKIDKAKKEYDRKLMKLWQSQKQIIMNKSRSDAIEKNFKIIEEIEREKRKRFEEFTDVRDKLNEEKAKKKEREDISKQHREREAKKLLSKQYKIAIEEASVSRNYRNIRTCDRQCLIVRSHGERCGKNQKKPLTQYEPDPKPLHKKVQFLFPQKKLIEELRQREQAPFPWTGTNGAHAQFAEVAGQVLAECKHKIMARRVVDEYRRLNKLDATLWPVKNY